jgi:hypothetical protein
MFETALAMQLQLPVFYDLTSLKKWADEQK